MIKIVHLSDLHINEPDYNYNHKNLVDALINDLRNFVDDDSIIVFSGDFLNEGGRNFSEEKNPYDAVNLFLEEITNKYNFLKERIFFVPGNHEINRGDLDLYKDFPFKENLLKNSDNLNNFISDFYSKGDSIEINGLKRYNDFASIYLSSYPQKQMTSLDNTFIVQVGEQRIGISCLNSSWLCYDDNDDGNIAIGINQIDHSLKFISDVDVKVCVVHHPLNYLSKKIEQEIIEKKIQNEYDIVLIGHTHQQKTNFIKGLDGNYFISVGKSLSGENSEAEVYKNGYSIVEYDKGNKVICHFRKYQDEKKEFIPLADALLDNGKLEINISDEVEVGNLRNGELSISHEFFEYLNDAGAKFTNKSSKDIKLSDIYVPPFLERFNVVDDEEKSNTVSNKYVINNIKAKVFKNTIILGEENSGKTTFCKVLYKELLSTDVLLPVYLKGKDLKESSVDRLEKIIQNNISKQYINYTKEYKNKIYLIIDDFKDCKLKFKFKRKLVNEIIESDYNSLIVWDEYFTINEFLDVKNIDVDIFEISQFGSKKRFELIKRWSDLVNEDEYIDEKDKIDNYYQVEKIIDTIIGKTLVPSFPIYILIVLQSNELTTTTSLEQSTFGYYYDVLIKSAIGEKVKKNKEIEKVYSYLSELSYYLYKKKTLKLTEHQFLEFHIHFNKAYGIEVSLKEMSNILIETQILKQSYGDDCYKFKYTYIYFYFLGKYLSENIDEDDIRKDIEDLSKKLFQSHAANVYMFLSHHSKSKFVIDKILENAGSVFSEAKMMNFKDDVEEINEMIVQTTESLTLETEIDYEKNKEQELTLKDALLIDDDTDEIEDKDTIEEIDFISEVNIAYKSIEILGHVLKNRYASLKANDKSNIINQVYQLSTRTLTSIFDVLLEGEDYLRKELLEIISNDSSLTEYEKDSLAKMIMFNMLYMVSYSVIKKVSTSVSSKDLKLTFNQVESENIDNNVIRLMSVANKLDYSTDFPLDDVKSLKEDFKKNKLPYYVLRRLGFNFLRLKPLNEIDQQKVAETLEISMQVQRRIEGKSRSK